MKNEAVNNNERSALRELAQKVADIAGSDIMSERKKLWKALHDLKPQRPMILFEPFSIEGYLSDYEFQCNEPYLRNVETRLIFLIKQYEHLDDDVVFEPYFRLPWWGKGLSATGKEYGEVKIVEHKAKQESMAYLSNFPIKVPDDLKKLKPRIFEIDKKPVLDLKGKLEDIFGDILPVKLGNFDNFDVDPGNQPFTGNNFIGITWDVFKLIGAEKMMLWAFDHPEALHELCRFLVDDRKSFYKFMLEQRLLDFNTDNQFAGPSMYGYVSGLPAIGTDKEVELKDLWTWPESQESEPFSPAMFNEFFLPYIAEIANMFGLSYYGCCERVTDRLEYIQKAIKNLRAVSISGWSDFDKAAELLGNRYVYSRKPVPAYISSEAASWDLVEKEALKTAKAAKNCCVEVIFRDAYSVYCTPERSAQWIKIWKRALGI
jgi:hypothetical protein